MGEKEKVQMPTTGGGLFRHSDAEGKGFKIRPEFIIITAGAVVVIEIILHAFV